MILFRIYKYKWCNKNEFKERQIPKTHPLGLPFLMSMLKTALNTNTIPHIWKLVKMVPIPKPNTHIDKGTLYMPISLLWRRAFFLT